MPEKDKNSGQERLDEIADILARGIIRMKKKGKLK